MKTLLLVPFLLLFSASAPLRGEGPRFGRVAVGNSSVAQMIVADEIGTGDFTVAVSFVVPTSVSGPQGVFYLSSSGTYWDARSGECYLYSDGSLNFGISGDVVASLTPDYVNAKVSGFVSAYGGSEVSVAVRRLHGVVTLWVNGSSLSYSTSSGGTNPTLAGAINGHVRDLGDLGNNYPLANPIGAFMIYNRGLSAAEISSCFDDYAGVGTVSTVVGGSAATIKTNGRILASDPTPLVIWFHGSGETDAEAFSNANEKRVTDALTAAGYIVASSSGGGSLWGNRTAQDAYVNLYNYVAARWTISNVYFVGLSMGGTTSLNLLASHRIPCSGWYGIQPCTNLSNCYTHVNPSSVEAAYGFSGSANYAAATSGYDPNLVAGSAFDGIRFRMTASASDATVPDADHGALLRSTLAGHATEASVLTVTGAHGDPSDFNEADVLDFFSRSP